MRIGIIILMPIRIWIGFNMEIRIRIGIKTMLITLAKATVTASPQRLPRWKGDLHYIAFLQLCLGKTPKFWGQFSGCDI
jgi:hypothetical protein